MPEVYNWQLGRKMLYPYEERQIGRASCRERV